MLDVLIMNFLFFNSLRSLVLVADGSSQAAPKKTDRLDEVHLNAGADLLNRYQFHWCRIREASERNYRLAQVGN